MNEVLFNANHRKYQVLKCDGEFMLLVQLERKARNNEFVVCRGWNYNSGSWGAAAYYESLDDALSDYNDSVDEVKEEEQLYL